MVLKICLIEIQYKILLLLDVLVFLGLTIFCILLSTNTTRRKDLQKNIYKLLIGIPISRIKLHRWKSFLLPTKINIAKLKKVFEILRVEIQKCFPQYFKKDPTLRISDCLEPFLLYIINISNLKMN